VVAWDGRDATVMVSDGDNGRAVSRLEFAVYPRGDVGDLLKFEGRQPTQQWTGSAGWCCRRGGGAKMRKRGDRGVDDAGSGHELGRRRRHGPLSG
jgi:hypothetical protein